MSNRFLLEAKNIIKTFPPTVALNDVHFCLRPGEIHGLMGENGSGKSTMCSIVSGIYGNVTGGLAVEKLGTAPAMPYKEEIMAALNK